MTRRRLYRCSFYFASPLPLRVYVHAANADEAIATANARASRVLSMRTPSYVQISCVATSPRATRAARNPSAEASPLHATRVAGRQYAGDVL